MFCEMGMLERKQENESKNMANNWLKRGTVNSQGKIYKVKIQQA